MTFENGISSQSDFAVADFHDHGQVRIRDPLFDSLTISPSGLNAPEIHHKETCVDIYGGDLRVEDPALDQLLTSKVVANESMTFRMRISGGGLRRSSVTMSSWDGATLATCVSENRFATRSRYRFSDSQGMCLGHLASNFMGSNYRFEPAGGLPLSLLTVDYESRISKLAEDLGPCRRFTATVFPRTAEYAPKEQPSISLQHQPMSTSCESFDIFSDSVLTSLRLVSMEPTKGPLGYTLDLGSAFTVIPSVKNFVLVNSIGERALSMCKIGKDEFELTVVGDFLTPLHAFAIAVSSIDRKLCTQ